MIFTFGYGLGAILGFKSIYGNTFILTEGAGLLICRISEPRVFLRQSKSAFLLLKQMSFGVRFNLQ